MAIKTKPNDNSLAASSDQESPLTFRNNPEVEKRLEAYKEANANDVEYYARVVNRAPSSLPIHQVFQRLDWVLCPLIKSPSCLCINMVWESAFRQFQIRGIGRRNDSSPARMIKTFSANRSLIAKVGNTAAHLVVLIAARPIDMGRACWD